MSKKKSSITPTIIRKTFAVERKTIDAEAGIFEAMISTEEVDRDGDVLRADGAELGNYMRNPVVLFGHRYNDVDAVVGKALEVTAVPGQGIRARFQFAGGDVNPKAETVRRLWAGEFLNATSVGFIPKQVGERGNDSERRGQDFKRWELLEFSIVPVPSNQSALRLAVRSFDDFLSTAVRQSDTKEPAAQQRAWVRRLSVESDLGQQTLLVAFRTHNVEVPEDATLLQMDSVFGECTEVLHPDAGKTVMLKDALFVPPLEFRPPEFSGEPNDAVYVLSSRDQPDDKMVSNENGLWSVLSLSDILASVEGATEAVGKSAASEGLGFGVDALTQRGIERARRMILRSQKLSKFALTKRGRVLSAKNEKKIRDARDNLDEVLKEVEEQPDESPREETQDGVAMKGPIASHETPKADPDTAWDGPAVVASLPNDREVLRRVHAWVDEKGDPDAKQSYKFPHHLADGRVVLRGVNNAMARLPQASIPDEDRAGVEAHLNRHQRQFEDEKSPTLLDADSERDLADSLQVLVHTLQEVYQ
jgi:hypothetical protein